MRLPPRCFGCLLLIAGLVIPLGVTAQDAVPATDGDNPPPEQDPIAIAIDQLNERDNGLTIDREARTVDVKAKVCLREGEFLEMFACTKDTREHESILVIETTPSTIHLALLLLGVEPGKPLAYDASFDPPKLVPATGPEVGVYVVREVAGEMRETPANRWVRDNQTQEMMRGNTWLFAGSVFLDYQGEQVYQADVNGSAVSLVNFGDDLLTLANDMTDRNESHNKVWAPRTQAIPEVGTEVILRLKPEPPADAKPDADEAAADPADADTGR